MATSVADLSINVAANVARAVEGLNSLGSAATRMGDQLQAAASVGRSFIEGLVGGLTVGAFTAAIKSTIDYADRLNDLSKSTGITVETLGGLGYAAKQSGTDIDIVAKGVANLGRQMAAAAGGNDQLLSLFSRMGVEIKNVDGSLRPLDKTLFDVADKFRSFKDGPEKAALAVELFKKGGEQLIPLLNEGGESLRAMVAEYERYGGVTTEVAQRSDAFNDTMEKIKLISSGLFQTIASALLPVLQTLANQFVSLRSDGTSFQAVAEGIAAVVKVLASAAAAATGVFQILGKSIASVAAALVQASQGNFRQAWDILKQGGEDVVTSVGGSIARVREIWESSTAGIASASAQNFDRATAPIKTAKDRIDSLAKAFDSALQTMRKALVSAEDNFATVSGAVDQRMSPSLKKLMDLMGSPQWDKFSETQRQWLIDIGLSADAIDHEADALKRATDAAQRYAEMVNRNNEAQFAASERIRTSMQGMVEGWQAQSDEIAFQITLIGKTAEEQERLTALRKIDLEVQRQLNALGEDYFADQGLAIIQAGEAAKKQIENNLALRNSLQANTDGWNAMFDAITNRGAAFIQDFVQNGSSAFKRLWEDFKSWALQALARIAAQEIVVSIAGSFGASGGGALGGLLGGGGGGLGDILGGLGSLFGGGGGGGGGLLGGLLGGLGSSVSAGLFSSLGGAGAAQAAALAAQTAGFGMAGTSATLAALGGVGGAMGAATTAVLAAVPVVGWIAAAGAALWSIFGGNDSVPKTGGSGGRAVNLANGEGWDLERRMFTPNDSDAAVQKFVESVANGFSGIAAALGVNSGAFGFHLGYDAHEEHGNRVSALVQDAAGGTIYEAKDVSVGEDIQGSLELYAKRSILAALQASDMPQYLADVFAGLDVQTAAEAEIDAAIEFAQGLKIVVAAVHGLGDQFSAIDPSDIQGFVEAFGGLESMIQGISFIGENFYTDAQKLATATQTLDGIFDDLGVSVPESHQAFLDLLNGIDLSTEAGRSFYQTLVSVAPLWVQVNGSAQDAVDNLDDASDSLDDVAESAEDLAKALNSIDVGVIANASQTMFEGMKAKIENLASAVDGTLGDELSVKISATQGEIDRVAASMYDLFSSGLGGTSEYQKLGDVLRMLNQYQAQSATTLARFTVLTAQFDAQRAAELVGLEQWYAEQQRIFAGNSEALDALRAIFDDKWDAIVNGVSTGVENTIGEMERLRASLAQWLQSLTVGNLSPLKPLERLEQARLQFEQQFGLAATGDKDALGGLTKYADQYLTLARDLYKSSETYTDIFDMVTQAIAQLAGTDQRGMPIGDNFAPEAMPLELLAAAVPANGERLASADDMRASSQATASSIIEAIAAASRANTEDLEELRAEVSGLRRTFDAKLETMK